MGHEATGRQLPATSQNVLEVVRSSAVQGAAGRGQRAAGDGRRATVPGEMGADSWELAVSPGRIIGLVGPAGSGLTTLGISLLASATTKQPVAVLDARGWFCPSLAWEAGIAPERLVVVRCPDSKIWPRVMATLLEGFPVVYAEVPRRVPDRALRRLGALARSRRSAAALRVMEGDLPTGLLHLRVEGVGIRWEGTDNGHGRLLRRVVAVEATGRGARGIDRTLELVEDDGSDTLRLVPGLATPPAGRATG